MSFVNSVTCVAGLSIGGTRAPGAALTREQAAAGAWEGPVGKARARELDHFVPPASVFCVWLERLRIDGPSSANLCAL